MSIRISGFIPGSPAEQLNIPTDSELLSINGEEINDVLDYGFYAAATRLELVFRLPDGIEEERKVRKGEYEELGIESRSFLMDKEHACRNGCIFCFVDQNPKGMRKSIYFKDDDERMSFLFGSYVTLTNLSDKDIDRIIRMKISPVNISVHTTDPELRCRMMRNRFAGESLKYMYRLAEAGVDLNCQIVLCRNWNDGEELRRTLKDLMRLYPSVGSVAVVPVGLTAHREGLEQLIPFDRESAAEAIDIIEPIAEECLKKYGERLVYASDEFYLLAGRKLPAPETYGEYRQLENGVGMCSMLEEEFLSALDMEDGDGERHAADIATGHAIADIIQRLAEKAREKFPHLDCRVRKIDNDFYGRSITVAGLLTAGDILRQVPRDSLVSDRLLLSETMLRRDGDRFLDDVTREEFEQRLGVPVRTVSDGADLLDAMLGR